MSNSTNVTKTFSTSNSQQDGKNTLKRMQFMFDGQKFDFTLNPEQYTQTEPRRVTVTQTKSGGWIDDFGAGLVTIDIKGTTGFRNSTSSNTNGFTKFQELRNLIRKNFLSVKPGAEVTKEMIFHNFTDGESWAVIPKTFTLMRSVSRPLLYLYDISLICIRPGDVPSKEFTDASTNTSPTLPNEPGSFGRGRSAVVPNKDKYKYKVPITNRSVLNAVYEEEDDTAPINKYSTSDTDSDRSPKTYMSSSLIDASDYVAPVFNKTMQDVLEGISSIVGDVSGLLTRSTLSTVTNNLDILPPGVLASVGGISDLNSELVFLLPFTHTKFNTTIPFTAFDIFRRMQRVDEDILYKGKSAKDKVYSPILQELDTVSTEVQSTVKLLHICLYTIYLDLVFFRKSGYPISFNRNQVKSLIKNCSWITSVLELIEPKMNLDLIEWVRYIDSCLSFLLQYDILFEGCKSTSQQHTSNMSLEGYKVNVIKGAM